MCCSQILKSAGSAGGHINPAVTLGFFIAGRISFIRGLLYTICQVLGAAVGAALIRAVRPLLQPSVLFQPTKVLKCATLPFSSCQLELPSIALYDMHASLSYLLHVLHLGSG